MAAIFDRQDFFFVTVIFSGGTPRPSTSLCRENSETYNGIDARFARQEVADQIADQLRRQALPVAPRIIFDDLDGAQATTGSELAPAPMKLVR